MTWDKYQEIESNSNIREAIETILLEIETKYQIKILLAADTGSRSCDIHSFGSDYDIKFVFTRPLRKQLSLFPASDTINFSSVVKLKEGYNNVDSIEINCGGFDIQKACQLLSTSNAALVHLFFESCNEKIGFRQDVNPFMTCLSPSTGFNFRQLGLHNRSIAMGVFKNKVTQEKQPIPVKNYLNIMRYVNIAEQIKSIMEKTGLEFNSFEHISTTDYSILPQEIQNFQKEMLLKRRVGDWNTERDEKMEGILLSLMEEERNYFSSFSEKGSEANEESKYKRGKQILGENCDNIYFKVIKSLFIEEKDQEE